MNARKRAAWLLSFAVAACAVRPSDAYSFREDFSVVGPVGEARGIDVVRHSHYSHGHGFVREGRYAILVGGNEHFLATPRLRNLRLTADWSVESACDGGCGQGLRILFRRNRQTGQGHELRVFRERASGTLLISADGRMIARRDADATDFAAGQRIVLTLDENRGTVETCGLSAGFVLTDGPESGNIAFDSLPETEERLFLRSLEVQSDEDPSRCALGTYRFDFGRTQGFAAPLTGEVKLWRYATGETLLEAELAGTVRGIRPGSRVQTGGGEWISILERLETPVVRLLGTEGRPLLTLPFWNGDRLLEDPEVVAAKDVWPVRLARVIYDLPSDFRVAFGYGRAVSHPWRFAEEGPREIVRTQAGAVIHDGAPLDGGRISVRVTSPADKQIAMRIPADIPRREAALKFAREQHCFVESEPVRFRLETAFADAAWASEEIDIRPSVADVYGDAVPGVRCRAEIVGNVMSGGVRRVVREVSCEGNLSVGVYRLDWILRAGADEPRPGYAVFEVLSGRPGGPCPPLASRLPEFVSMPNETKFLEQSAFDPWGEMGGAGHYFAVDNRYPKVGEALEIWRLLPLYGRRWWCWNWHRNSGDCDEHSERTKELIRRADVFGGDLRPERSGESGRYELGVASFYRGYQLRILRDFVAERKPGLSVLTPEAIDAHLERKTALTTDELRDLFETCWREWKAYVRLRIDASEQAFADSVLSVNPKAAFGSYGPYAFYVSHYKTAYALTYGGYPILRDRRLRENGSFWIFEEYHHSCDYPLFRPALFVATYGLHYGDCSRRIFPEIYYSEWLRCLDGAVYLAHPLTKTTLADSHQRRIAYRYVYGTPQFRQGAYRFWTDDGFHSRNPDKGAMEEFVKAWRNVVKNRPAKALKAPFVVHDLAALARNGEYYDDECSAVLDGEVFADIGNSAEDDLAYGYEQIVRNGYTTPVVTTFDELSGLDAAKAEFVVLPPIVAGTPASVLDGIRALHARGVNLLAFEQVVGLEDLFGVKRTSDRPVRRVGRETFSHRLAVARYAAEGAEIRLNGSETAEGPDDVPIVAVKQTAFGRTAFVNVPPSMIRRATFRQVYHWGQDSLCESLKTVLAEALDWLAPQPAVKCDEGLVSSALTASGDVVVVVSNEPPIYNDRTIYPQQVRFSVRYPGIGERTVAADAGYSVVRRERDVLVLRTCLARDSANFFCLGQSCK